MCFANGQYLGTNDVGKRPWRSPQQTRPPKTLTTLLNCDGAFAATFTVTVMEDWEPAFRVPAVEQVVLEQLHPVPDIDTSDSPVGIVSGEGDRSAGG